VALQVSQLSFSAALKNLFFPARCLACDRQLGRSRRPQICDDCRPLFSPVVSPLCPGCGKPYPAGEDHFCEDCLLGHFAFDRARAIFIYREPVKSLLLSLKFGGKMTGLATLGTLATQAGLATLFAEPDLVLPVPLHIQRLRSRGFNQSLLLARTCFTGWKNKISPDLLLRLQATRPQTSLSGKARRTNLRGAFAVSRPQEIMGKRILLVDDIFTTGSTLHECAKILRQTGALQIEAFTLARTL